jgi:hypothetical protein
VRTLANARVLSRAALGLVSSLVPVVRLAAGTRAVLRAGSDRVLVLSGSRNDATFGRADGHRLSGSSHERLLGPIAGSLRRYMDDGPVQLDRMSTSFERSLRQRGGRVAATSSGYFGDSGVGATAYLFLEPNSHRRVIRSEEDYRCYVESRQVLRSASRPTINDGSFCMSGSIG